MRATVDWERGIGEAEAHGSSAVRVIEVTAAVRRADERRQKERAEAMRSAWPLRGVFAAPEAAQVQRSVHMAESSNKYQRMVPCKGLCGRRTEPTSKGGKCYDCRKHDAKEELRNRRTS